MKDKGLPIKYPFDISVFEIEFFTEKNKENFKDFDNVYNKFLVELDMLHKKYGVKKVNTFYIDIN